MSRSLLVPFAAVLSLTACQRDPVKVSNTSTSDYGRAQLHQAVSAFVAAGRTPTAYAALSNRVFDLLPTMDKTVADEAELKLTVLALAPIQEVQARTVQAQAAALATTVWPTAFAERPRATTQLRAASRQSPELWPLPMEDVQAYQLRICAGPLSQVCRDAVPEHHAALLSAHAVHRFTERARSAVSDCLECSTDPSWRAAVRGWDELDTANNVWIRAVEKRGVPSNWPVAGPGAESYVALPQVEISALGEFSIDGQPLPPAKRRKELRAMLHGKAEVALHVRPETSLASLRELGRELRRAGVTSIAVVTREAKYPWTRKLYRVAVGRGRRVEALSNDTLQVLLQQIDPIGPGITRLE